jgi:hypothetical protein
VAQPFRARKASAILHPVLSFSGHILIYFPLRTLHYSKLLHLCCTRVSSIVTLTLGA